MYATMPLSPMPSTIMGKVPKKPYKCQAVPRLAFFQGEPAENGAGKLLTSLLVDLGGSP